MESAPWGSPEPVLLEVRHDMTTDEEPPRAATADPPTTLSHLKALLERLKAKRVKSPQG